MIENDYVSFEQAKALKELGMDVECNMCYRFLDNNTHPLEHYLNMDFMGISHKYLTDAPSQSLVQKWLREEKNLVIELIYNASRHFVYTIYIDGNPDKISLDLHPYDKYEQALSAAIDKCIVLLKENERKL